MKGASKVIMAATLVMVVSLAFVLALILVLLAELYCSLLLRSRRRLPHLKDSTTATSSMTNTSTAPAASASASASTIPTNTYTNSTTSFSSQDNQDQYTTNPLSSLYAHGVLQAPTNFLFPCKQIGQGLDIVKVQESNASPPQIGTLSPSASASASFATSPQDHVQEISIVQVAACKEINKADNLVYILNPIYDNDREDTPFETPDTSPSRLGINSGSVTSSGDDDDDVVVVRSVVYSPPLSPIEKLPAAHEACSVSLSLRYSTALGTSDSDSNTNNNCPSSSSSPSPCTSPW